MEAEDVRCAIVGAWAGRTLPDRVCFATQSFDLSIFRISLLRNGTIYIVGQLATLTVFCVC
jgi:hypothetical protein